MSTILQQGSFTSDGNAKTLSIRSDIDWMKVYNLTAADGATNGDGVEYYWQRGMTNGRGLYWYHPAGDQTVAIDQLAANTGFFYIDSSLITSTQSPNLVTDITGAAPAVVSSVAHGLVTGDIFRLVNCVGAQQITSIDFTATTLTADTFSPTWMAAIVAAAAPGAGAYVRKVSYDPIFYPRNRTISAITQAAQAVVTMTVTHGLTVGQKVRFSVPQVTAAAYGMTELDGLIGNITAINVGNNTITVDINSTGFAAFAFPLTADVSFTPAQVIPLGEDIATARAAGVNELLDATRNTAFIGMSLAGGVAGPGGDANDVIYWVAGKSFSVDNE